MDGKDAALDSTRTLHRSCRLATVLLVNGPMTVRRGMLIRLEMKPLFFCWPSDSEVTYCFVVDRSDLKQNLVFLWALSFRGDPPLCGGSDLKQTKLVFLWALSFSGGLIRLETELLFSLSFQW